MMTRQAMDVVHRDGRAFGLRFYIDNNVDR
jgi:hypothetical protein